jgi:hypothetical protein
MGVATRISSAKQLLDSKNISKAAINRVCRDAIIPVSTLIKVLMGNPVVKFICESIIPDLSKN